ncbi:clindamycin resistance transfer factor BtgB [Bacteroidia bacterium]|nr:clindamycin resistance transfer factor BtgB [Bacteroidia bacterium]
MNIDFPPPSNGIYNNAGSSRQLVNYMEHEDMERIANGDFTEGFFNLAEDGIFKADVIRRIDANIGQLMKTDAKFYAIHVSPSATELVQMGKTEKEQSDAMKRYIREVFIPAYAKNFNKGLDANDILFYGKIHFNRARSDKASFMHCHLIVSRKDQSNKKKLSPLTNHRNTKQGAIKGGFDRKNLFQQAESGFDKLFGYQRDLQETFVYCNTMKNGTMDEKLDMQERSLSNDTKMNFQHEQHPLAKGYDEVGNIASALGSLLPLDSQGDYDEGQAEYLRLHKKKKKKYRGISR